jgi:hypothetical protein
MMRGHQMMMMRRRRRRHMMQAPHDRGCAHGVGD